MTKNFRSNKQWEEQNFAKKTKRLLFQKKNFHSLVSSYKFSRFWADRE